MHEAPIPAGKDRHYDYEQYLRGGHDEVAKEEVGTILMDDKLPDVLVPTIAITEGVTVNLSVCQQVTREVQGGWVRTLQYQGYDSAHLEQMVWEVYHVTCQK
jgi:hypothetical protein